MDQNKTCHIVVICHKWIAHNTHRHGMKNLSPSAGLQYGPDWCTRTNVFKTRNSSANITFEEKVIDESTNTRCTICHNKTLLKVGYWSNWALKGQSAHRLSMDKDTKNSWRWPGSQRRNDQYKKSDKKNIARNSEGNMPQRMKNSTTSREMPLRRRRNPTEVCSRRHTLGANSTSAML